MRHVAGRGAAIVWGACALCVVVAGLMHRAFVHILKSGAAEPAQKENHE
jgi:hypothetical protein